MKCDNCENECPLLNQFPVEEFNSQFPYYNEEISSTISFLFAGGTVESYDCTQCKRIIRKISRTWSKS